MRSHVHMYPFIVLGSSKTNDNELNYENINVDNDSDVVDITKCKENSG